jgi:hypothetical protein
MPDFGIFRGFNDKLFGDKLVAGQLPTQLGLIGSKSIGFIGILDLYPNAAIAYSVRKLRASYTGSAIRVRRSSDNAEQNIGFDGSGNLDTTALTSFCSGTDGFVTTWYDQSGNGNNQTQTTATSQPRIVNNGVIDTYLSKPAIFFDGSNDFMINSNVSLASDFSVFVVQDTPNGDGYAILGEQTSNSRFSGISTGANPDILGVSLSTSTSIMNLQNLDTFDGIIQYIRESSNITVNYNGVDASNNPQSNNGSMNFNQIMKRSSFRYSSNTITELIVYLSNKSTDASNIRQNINTYYGIY